MGMFDWLDIECDLGKYNFLRERVDNHPPFQTKSLFRTLQTFTLTREGKLVWENGLDTNYSGVINFYTVRDRKMYSFDCKFSEGKLVCYEVCVSLIPVSPFLEREEKEQLLKKDAVPYGFSMDM